MTKRKGRRKVVRTIWIGVDDDGWWSVAARRMSKNYHGAWCPDIEAVIDCGGKRDALSPMYRGLALPEPGKQQAYTVTIEVRQ